MLLYEERNFKTNQEQSNLRQLLRNFLEKRRAGAQMELTYVRLGGQKSCLSVARTHLGHRRGVPTPSELRPLRPSPTA